MTTDTTITADQVIAALVRVADALINSEEQLTELDQKVGDGDLGLTAGKVGNAIKTYVDENDPEGDLGKYMMTGGMKVNSAAASTMGTLLATALMSMGKEAKGMGALKATLLATMLNAAEQGMLKRGKAKLGDKTIIDALDPARQAFIEAIEADKSLREAGEAMLNAAETTFEESKEWQSKIGRASWLGERTKGLYDPGMALLIAIIRAVLGFEKPAENLANSPSA